MQPLEIFDSLKGAFAEGELAFWHQAPSDPYVTVAPARLSDLCRVIRDRSDLSFDYLRCLSAVDLTERLAVVYHLFSLKLRHSLVLKVFLDRNVPEVASVQDIWSAANWYERAAFDLMGLTFIGHPDLARIMMPRDWVGHPLRKDYAQPTDYHGIPTVRPGNAGGSDA